MAASDVAARMAAMATRCGGCTAQITWCITEGNRRRQPVNSHPDPTGNLVVYADERGTLISRVELYGVVGLLEPADTPADRWVPHHATCPAAPQYRRT